MKKIKKPKKVNYQIVRSMFGDYWVGWTTKPVDKKGIFATLIEAKNKTEQLIEDKFFGVDDDDLNKETAFDELQQITEENIEQAVDKFGL